MVGLVTPNVPNIQPHLFDSSLTFRRMQASPLALPREAH